MGCTTMETRLLRICSSMLDEGHKAPDFEAPIDSGGTLSLESLRGNPVVLYFYPKDATEG